MSHFALKCAPSHSLIVLLIYCPLKPNSSFFPEIHNLLISLCSVSNNIVIVGDVNIEYMSKTSFLQWSSWVWLNILDWSSMFMSLHTPGDHTWPDYHWLHSINNLQVYDLDMSNYKVISVVLILMSPAKWFFRTGKTLTQTRCIWTTNTSNAHLMHQ